MQPLEKRIPKIWIGWSQPPGTKYVGTLFNSLDQICAALKNADRAEVEKCLHRMTDAGILVRRDDAPVKGDRREWRLSEKGLHETRTALGDKCSDPGYPGFPGPERYSYKMSRGIIPTPTDKEGVNNEEKKAR